MAIKKFEHDHLYRKAGESVWYVRLTIPADVRPAFGNRKTITKTTGTANRSEALVVRLSILAEWKSKITAARESKIKNVDEWKQAQHEVGKELNEQMASAAQRIYSTSAVESSDADQTGFLNDLYDLYTSLIDQGHADQAQRIKDWVYTYAAKIERGMSTGEALDLFNEYLKLPAELGIEATAEEYSLTKQETEEARQITFNPSTYKPRSPISRSMLDQWYKYLESQVATPKTRDMHRNRMQKLSDWLTQQGVELSFDSVHTFLESVSPSRSTRQNYLWSGRDFWKWACKYHPTFREQFGSKICPFDGHSLPKTGKGAGESYIPFTKAEVEDLHSKALASNDSALAALIAFGAYTGCRLEEIGRIHKNNTKFKGGIPVSFEIGKSKTDAGVRELPIHSQLIPLYQSLLEASQDGFLFKGGKNKYGNRLDPLSKDGLK
jgi:integrase